MRSAARLIDRPKRNASVIEICKQLDWLPIPQRAEYKVLTLVYKVAHGEAPAYLSSMLQQYQPKRPLRSTSSNLLSVKKTRVRYGKRAFSVCGPELWGTIYLRIFEILGSS